MSKALPNIVSKEEWQKASEKFREREKIVTYQRDLLNAERRQLPMYPVKNDYKFEGRDKNPSFLELFEGRSQLVHYHFMYHPKNDNFCPGCSWWADQVGNLAHLNARDTSFVMTSPAPLKSIERHRERMGWKLPWYSSLNNTFTTDMDMKPDPDQTHGLSVFLRDGDKIYRSYLSLNRGTEYLGSTFSLLDITPYGRQESWEDSPEGWPQSEPYVWWRMHDEYENSKI